MIRAAIAFTLLLLGFASGWQVQGWRWEAVDAERAQLEQQARDAARQQADAAAAAYEGQREAVRVQFQTITQEVQRVVERPVYRNVCLDADGLRQLRAAAGDHAAAPEHGASVPGPDAAR